MVHEVGSGRMYRIMNITRNATGTCRAKREHLKIFCLKNGSSKGQNMALTVIYVLYSSTPETLHLALTVLYVPYLLDRGTPAAPDRNDICTCYQEGRCKATWKREFKLPWREAGTPDHHDDKVDSDQ